MIVISEISNRRRVQRRVVRLHRAAVELIAILLSRSQLKTDEIAIPLSISRDVVGVEARGGQRAIPRAKQSRLKRSKRRELQIVAAARDGRPVQVLIRSPCLLDQRDAVLLCPARAAKDLAVFDARRRDRVAV